MPKHLAADLVEGAWRADREERVELMLDPVELGRVRFELVPEGDRLQVLVSVERQDTLDLLRRNIDLLRAEFREAGFPAADLSFGQWGSGEGQRPDRHLPPPDTAHDLIPQADHAKNLSPSTPAGRTAAGGLDLRL